MFINVLILINFRVRAYGPGIQPTGPVVGAPAVFTVETFSAGKGSVQVAVTNPKGKLEPVSTYIFSRMRVNVKGRSKKKKNVNYFQKLC